MLPELATAQRQDPVPVQRPPVVEQAALVAQLVGTTAPAAAVELHTEDGVVGDTLLAVSVTMLPELATAQRQDLVPVQRPTVGEQAALVAQLVGTTAPAAAVKLHTEDGVAGYHGVPVPVIIPLEPEQNSATGHVPVRALPVEGRPAVAAREGWRPCPVMMGAVRPFMEAGLSGMSGRATVISRRGRV
eukprot:sb/3471277/